MSKRNYLIIDACVLLNLIATGVIREILTLIAQNLMICVLVRNESLYLRKEDDINENETVNIVDLINQSVIQLCDCETTEEQELFVNLAASLDDGEAMSIAIALSRNWYLATDDKKARKIFKEYNLNSDYLLSTTDLIRHWVENANLDNLEISKILVKVERKARFRPPKSDPNLQWWIDRS